MTAGELNVDRKTWTFMLGGLALAVALAVLVSPFASTSPDGLDRVSEDHGFADRSEGAQVWQRAPIADYSTPGVEGPISTSVAGLLGTVGVAGLGYLGARLLRARRAPHQPPER